MHLNHQSLARIGRWITIGLVVGLFLGSPPIVSAAEPILHYKPANHVLGDVHPYFRDGECYLYSLVPRTFDVELVRSKDLLNWQQLAVRHDPPMPGEWKSPYYVLGVFFDPSAKIYRSFYSLAGGKGRIVSSQSADLLNWSCAPKDYTIPPEENYLRRRDPFVFWIPELKEYGCVMCLQQPSKAGAVSLATSANLRDWTPRGNIVEPPSKGEPECPQMFRLGNRWYLLASVYDRGVGAPSYWMSDSALGPWSPKRTGVLDGNDLCAAQIAFDGDKPILFGWIPLVPAAGNGGKQYWGGHLALPREVHALPDGTLGTRLHTRVAERMNGQPAHTLNEQTIDATPKVLNGQWDHISMTMKLAMPRDVREVRIGFDPLGEVVLSRTDNALLIRDLQHKTETKLAVNLSSLAARTLQIVVDGDIVELFVSDRYSLAARLFRTQESTKGITRIRFETTGGNARLSDLEVVKLPGDATAR